MKTLPCWAFLPALLLLTLVSLAQKLRETEWERGMVDKKTKVGVWEYFGRTPSQRQVLVQRYDHDTKKLLYYRPIGEILYRTETAPSTWRMQRLDQPPLFIGGDAALAAYTTRLNYPAQAQDRNVQGRVVIGFVIDTLGRAADYKIITKLGSGCDEEALRVVRGIPPEWIPGRIGSRAVPVEYELPLTFRLAQ